MRTSRSRVYGHNGAEMGAITDWPGASQVSRIFFEITCLVMLILTKISLSDKQYGKTFVFYFKINIESLFLK